MCSIDLWNLEPSKPELEWPSRYDDIVSVTLIIDLSYPLTSDVVSHTHPIAGSYPPSPPPLVQLYIYAPSHLEDVMTSPTTSCV